MKNNNNNNIFLLLFHFSLEFWLYFEIVRIIYGNNQLHTWSSKGWIVKMQSRVTRIENLLIKKGTNELYRLFHSNSTQLLFRTAFAFKMPYAYMHLSNNLWVHDIRLDNNKSPRNVPKTLLYLTRWHHASYLYPNWFIEEKLCSLEMSRHAP